MKPEPSLQHLLRKLKQKNFFNENEYNKLCPSGSALARIYGTPKMHKFSSSDSFPKRCAIVSSIGTFNYNLPQFLCDLLSPLVPNDNSCKKTFSFVSQIKNAHLSRKSLVSYDVTSLFTNILLQETIDIAINLIFNYNPNLNITKKEIKKLTLFATSHARFIFNSKIYNQIDGVATGSPHGFFFAFLFHLLFLLSLTLINGIFYCLHYTSLLLHLITTHLVSHLSLSSFISSISKLIIGIFYCLD